MKRCVSLAVVASCAIGTFALAGASPAALPPFSGPVLRVSPLEGTHSKPQVAVAADRMWIAYVTTHHAGDFIALRTFDGEDFSRPIRVSARPGVEFHPAVSADPRGGVWIAWAARREGKWTVLARRASKAEELSAEYVVASGGDCSWRPALAVERNGAVWAAWERCEGKESRIVARRFDGRSWGEEVLVSGELKECRRPAVAVDARGRVVFAWDSFLDGRYVLLARGMKDGRLGPEFVLARDGPFVNADCTLVPDPDDKGRVWFTYCNRRYQLRCLDGETVLTPSSRTGGQSRAYMALALDGKGRPWMCGQRLSVWCWDSRGCSRTVSARPKGPWNIMGERSTLCLFDGNLWIVWEEVAGNISMRPYAVPRSLGGPPALQPFKAKPAKERPVSRPDYPPIRYQGREYRVRFGDLHTHAEASEGCGYIDWVYHRARDVFRMDFHATTDHDACTPDLLSPSEWAEIQEHARRFDDPPRFCAFPGWEVSSSGQRGRYGDRNVICIDHEQPHVNSSLAVANRPDRLYSALDPARYLVQAGHHVSRRFAPTDWDFHTPPVVPFVEISSCHGVFEYTGNPKWPRDGLPGHSVQDGLARGHRLGIMASTDNHHPASYGPSDVTAAFATENTRAALWEAFRARRVYAVRGGRLFIDFRVDGRLMGEEFFVKTPGAHRVTAAVRSPDGKPLGKLEIIRNNEVVHTVEAGDPEAEIDFTDDGRTGTVTTYYYLRVTQKPGRQMAWTSPVWATLLDVRPEAGRLLVPPGEKRKLKIQVRAPQGPKAGTLRARPPEGWTVSPAELAFACAPGEPFEAALAVTAPGRDAKEKGALKFAVTVDGTQLAVLRDTTLHLDQWPEEGFRAPAAETVADPRKVAANHLAPSGADEEPAAKHFLRNWAVLGPFHFDREEYTSLECRDAVDFVPDGVDESALEPVLGREVAGRRWVPYRAYNLGNKYGSKREYIVLDCGGMSIDIVENAVAYLAANVYSPEEVSDYQILAGSDDYVKIWLNGELLMTYNGERRGAAPDGDRRRGVRLNKGRNLLLVKLVNINSGWGMYVRLAAADGRAIEVRDE